MLLAEGSMAGFLLFLVVAIALAVGAHGATIGENVRTIQTRGGESKIVLGYYSNWAQYRPNPYQYFPENLDPALYTHLAYAFAVVEDGTFKITPYEWNDVLDYGDGGMYKRFNNFARQKNPSIKTLISLGGWNFSQNFRIFNGAAATPESREKFTSDIISFVRKYKFDGVDIDWEYPEAADKDNFTAVLALLRQKIKAEAAETGQPEILLAIAVSADHNRITERYDAAKFGDLVDWVGLMTYDLYGAWESQTRSHTQLFPVDSSNAEEMAVSRSVEGWAKYVPYNKLLMGVATYGRTFSLANPSEKTSHSCNMLAKTVTPAPAGTYTREPGFMSYYEIKKLINEGATVCEDKDGTKTAVVQTGNMWIGFDNEYTVTEKVNWANSKGVLGIMFWAVDLDDFKNGNPIMSLASGAILSGSSEPVASSITAVEPLSSTQTETSVPPPETSSISLEPSFSSISLPSFTSTYLSPSSSSTSLMSLSSTSLMQSSSSTSLPQTLSTSLPPSSSSTSLPQTLSTSLPPSSSSTSLPQTLSTSLPPSSSSTSLPQTLSTSLPPSSSSTSLPQTLSTSLPPSSSSTSLPQTLSTSLPPFSTTLSSSTSASSTPTTASVCHSIVSHVSTEWCIANGCEAAYPTICKDGESDADGGNDGGETDSDNTTTCKSLDPSISDEWCAANGCETAYPTICKSGESDVDGESGNSETESNNTTTCKSLAPNVSDEWCAANGCETAYPTICSNSGTDTEGESGSIETDSDNATTCKSLAPNVSDEWCAANGCETAYPTICTNSAGGTEGDSDSSVPKPSDKNGCKSIVSHISDEWCEANGCAAVYPTFCKAI